MCDRLKFLINLLFFTFCLDCRHTAYFLLINEDGIEGEKEILGPMWHPHLFAPLKPYPPLWGPACKHKKQLVCCKSQLQRARAPAGSLLARAQENVIAGSGQSIFKAHRRALMRGGCFCLERWQTQSRDWDLAAEAKKLESLITVVIYSCYRTLKWNKSWTVMSFYKYECKNPKYSRTGLICVERGTIFSGLP